MRKDKQIAAAVAAFVTAMFMLVAAVVRGFFHHVVVACLCAACVVGCSSDAKTELHNVASNARALLDAAATHPELLDAGVAKLAELSAKDLSPHDAAHVNAALAYATAGNAAQAAAFLTPIVEAEAGK